MQYPLYGGGVYTSTKYAIKGLAEAVRLELLPYNIGVTLVCPGFIETPMLDKLEGKSESLFCIEILLSLLLL